MKQTLAAMCCATVLVASLAACDGAGNKAALPNQSGGPSPSATATSGRSSTTPSAPRPTGPFALAAHSTNAFGDLKLVVNLPTGISSASRPRMRLFAAFLQGVGRTTALNRLDPSVSRLASANVVKSVQTFTDEGSVQAIGSLVFTVSKVQTSTSGVAVISGCVDQSKVVQVRKDGSHYVAGDIKKYPTRKMTARINPEKPGPKVTAFTFAPGTC